MRACEVFVVANTDGPDPDSGTSWECGYAYRKKPVILFPTDFRTGYKLGGDRLQTEEVPGNLSDKTDHRVRYVGFLQRGDLLGCQLLGNGGDRIVEVVELGGADDRCGNDGL